MRVNIFKGSSLFLLMKIDPGVFFREELMGGGYFSVNGSKGDIVNQIINQKNPWVFGTGVGGVHASLEGYLGEPKYLSNNLEKNLER